MACLVPRRSTPRQATLRLLQRGSSTAHYAMGRMPAGAWRRLTARQPSRWRRNAMMQSPRRRTGRVERPLWSWRWPRRRGCSPGSSRAEATTSSSRCALGLFVGMLKRDASEMPPYRASGYVLYSPPPHVLHACVVHSCPALARTVLSQVCVYERDSSAAPTAYRA